MRNIRWDKDMDEGTIKRYRSPDRNIWQGRKDSQSHERLFQVVTSVDLLACEQNAKFDYGFIGFSCDEGVKRNLGRPGAAHGPSVIRSVLGNWVLESETSVSVADFGDVYCADSDLDQSQLALSEIVSMSRKAALKTVVLGGGHETAWGHYLGLPENQSEYFGIINIDAHFDMRPLNDGKGSSGTPFLQIAEHRAANNLPFNYFCVGIQESANTRSIKRTAQEWGTHVILARDVHGNGCNEAIKRVGDFIRPLKEVYLTICLDAIASPYAPGVSAPQVYGLMPWDTRKLVRHIAQSGKLVSADIVEYAPSFDTDNRTAQLACGLISELLV